MESLHNQLIKRQIGEMQMKTVESLSHSSQNSYHQGNQKQILVRVEVGVGER